MIVVVHSFVADSSLLDCCDLMVCFFPPYACRWATVWVFEVVSAVLFLSFGVSCLLATAVHGQQLSYFGCGRKEVRGTAGQRLQLIIPVTPAA